MERTRDGTRAARDQDIFSVEMIVESGFKNDFSASLLGAGRIPVVQAEFRRMESLQCMARLSFWWGMVKGVSLESVPYLAWERGAFPWRGHVALSIYSNAGRVGRTLLLGTYPVLYSYSRRLPRQRVFHATILAQHDRKSTAVSNTAARWSGLF
ncbi:hypothetical protein TNIN_751 [Trichonephila inaurata madagascariensis]|uniref:Uncharacterized protein n=1 Tax=Trichonephila inaurata madagascariensis TaxID=2747483 RepID=A0A8X6YQ99_9ARAC|nr:hypothetical protein TNIN_751 [Trichonephila inaurata madagascariensis]